MKKKIAVLAVLIVLVAIATVVFFYKEEIMAYYTSHDQKINTATVGDIEVTVTEPNYVDNQVIKPNESITKDPTFSNSGEVDGYVRAQVYVPISDSIKYVDNEENIVTPADEIEIFSYEVNSGWVEVTDDPSDTYKFNGIYEDLEGNRYKVRTYKYMQGGVEKITAAGETISTPLFDEVSVINYLDTDTTVNLKMHVVALGVQSSGGTANEMWDRFKNQNQAGIVGVE